MTFAEVEQLYKEAMVWWE